MPDITDTQAIVSTAQEAVDVQEIHPGIFAAHQNLKVHDLRRDIARRMPRPERKEGTFTFTAPAGLVGYLAKHGLPETELFGDVDKGTITAIINAHDGDTAGIGEVSDAAGWADHTATLTLRKSDDWAHWTSNDGKWFGQREFAEFIEQHLPNCVDPNGATMLELSQSFRATKAVNFEASKRLKSGETTLEYRESIDATAGKRGAIAIPDEISLALTPFEHGDPYKVTARLRYRIDGGQLAMSYVLIRPRDVLLDAFRAVAALVESETGRRIWEGTTG